MNDIIKRFIGFSSIVLLFLSAILLLPLESEKTYIVTFPIGNQVYIYKHVELKYANHNSITIQRGDKIVMLYGSFIVEQE